MKENNMDINSILEKQEKYMWGTWNYYQRPISIARGEGLYVWDTDGNKYLTCLAACSPSAPATVIPGLSRPWISWITHCRSAGKRNVTFNQLSPVRKRITEGK
jgi:hypothetical protein